MALQLDPEHKEAREYYAQLRPHAASSQEKSPLSNLVSKRSESLKGDYKFVHKKT